jgi:hypothetical protein
VFRNDGANSEDIKILEISTAGEFDISGSAKFEYINFIINEGTSIDYFIFGNS